MFLFHCGLKFQLEKKIPERILFTVLNQLFFVAGNLDKLGVYLVFWGSLHELDFSFPLIQNF